MKDNELYTYFKSKSTAFDEMPSAALWDKIETHIDHKPASFFKRKATGLTLIIPFVLLISAGIVFMNQSKHSRSEEAAVTLSDTVKKKKVVMVYDSVGTAKPSKFSSVTWKKKESEYKALRSNTGTVPDIMPNEPTAPTGSFQVAKEKKTPKELDISFPEANKPKVVFSTTLGTLDTVNRPKYVPTKAVLANNNIIYSTTASLSKEEYDVFINDLTEKNKDSIGKQIIFKARGHAVKRILIKEKEHDAVLKGMLIEKDSLKTISE